MKVAILETGSPPPELEPRFGRYPAMFERLLGAGSVEATYDVTRGKLPGSMLDHGAYLITGSAAGVYEDLPWIAPLKHFLRDSKGKAKLVGVCFGHQVMAESFGGKVARSDKGWAVGLRQYQVLDRAPWMDDAECIAVPVSHQDQVIEQPGSTRLLVGCAYESVAVLAYQDQPAISFQCHPEFAPEYAAALIELRRGQLKNADAAIASLDKPNDNERLAGWIRRFLEGT
jgi:GMP synthase-like glutamine amidotransferase